MKDYEIDTDFIGNYVPECKPELIAIARNMTCSVCEYNADIEPMISDGNDWFCMSCWVESGNQPLSENMKNKVKESTLTTKRNLAIWSM